jgi:hypothetical protein
MLGRGGKREVVSGSGVSRNTVTKAEHEVEDGIEPSERPRHHARCPLSAPVV